MRSTYRALIAASVFAVASHLWAQDTNATPAATPTPVSAQPTTAAQENIAPAVPVVESPLALEAIPVPAEAANPEAVTAPVILSSSDSPAMVAPKPSKPPRVRKPREVPQESRIPENSAPAAVAAAAATSDTTTNPPASTGAAATAVESAVRPAPIAEQLPVSPTAAEPARADRASGSMWLLVGGLLLGVIGIFFMRRRRGRSESVSIVERTGPISAKDVSFAIAPEKRS
jgi:hypothetical protein